MRKKSKKRFKLDNKECVDSLALIEKPEDALDVRLNLIDEAEKTIDICYYKIDATDSSTIFFKKLLDAADRGIKIRLILNKVTDTFIFYKKWRKELLIGHPNISLYFYTNPMFNFYKAQDNLHDKALIIDDKYLLTGGRNIGDRFFIDDDHVVYDLDILLKRIGRDSAIDSYKRYFECLIDSGSVKKVDFKKSYYSRLEDNMLKLENLACDINYKERDVLSGLSFYDSSIYFVHNSLNEVVKDPLILENLRKLIKESDRIKWLSPYIVFTKAIRKILDIGFDKDITFVTNSAKTTPNLPGFSATLHYISYLKKYANVKAYVGKGSVHTKAIVFDNDISCVGSLNIDPRSAFLSTETMAFIESEDFNRKLCEYIDKFNIEDWDKSKEKISLIKEVLLFICFILSVFFISFI